MTTVSTLTLADLRAVRAGERRVVEVHELLKGRLYGHNAIHVHDWSRWLCFAL